MKLIAFCFAAANAVASGATACDPKDKDCAVSGLGLLQKVRHITQVETEDAENDGAPSNAIEQTLSDDWEQGIFSYIKQKTNTRCKSKFRNSEWGDLGTADTDEACQNLCSKKSSCKFVSRQQHNKMCTSFYSCDERQAIHNYLTWQKVSENTPHTPMPSAQPTPMPSAVPTSTPIPETVSPNPPRCDAGCVRHGKVTPAKCASSSCSGCSPCSWKLDPQCLADDVYCSCSAGGSGGEADGYFVANTEVLNHRLCRTWCATNAADWDNKCSWLDCAACMGKKPKNGCCVTTTTTTTMDPAMGDMLKKQKNGLLCSKLICLQAFGKSVSWMYNYNLFVTDPQVVQLINDYGIEYVPMSDRPVEWGTAKGSACTWVKPLGGYFPQRKCDISDIIDSVTMMNDQLTTASKAKYLAMFNEAYLDCQSEQCQGSYIDPKDLVNVWRKYFIPAAEQLGLKLLSPTFKGDEEKYLKWTANVLGECYKLRNTPNHPCDIWSLKALSVHAYQCSEKYYKEYYSRHGAHSWTDNLLLKLEGILGSEMDIEVFTKFFDETPVWVTEFSCAADSTYQRYEDGFKDAYGYGQAPYDEQCRRASGQMPTSHGAGVFPTLTAMPEIGRFSWFGLVVAANFGTTYVGAGNNLITKDGTLMPTGKLFAAHHSEQRDLDCSMPGGDFSGDGNGGTENPDQGSA